MHIYIIYVYIYIYMIYLFIDVFIYPLLPCRGQPPGGAGRTDMSSTVTMIIMISSGSMVIIITNSISCTLTISSSIMYSSLSMRDCHTNETRTRDARATRPNL